MHQLKTSAGRIIDSGKSIHHHPRCEKSRTSPEARPLSPRSEIYEVLFRRPHRCRQALLVGNELLEHLGSISPDQFTSTAATSHPSTLDTYLARISFPISSSSIIRPMVWPWAAVKGAAAPLGAVTVVASRSISGSV